MRLKIFEKIRIERKLENEILFHTKKIFTATCFLSFSISIFGAETICQMAIAEKVETYRLR
jgi:hypothetical protein